MVRLPLWLTQVRSNSMVPCLRDGRLVWTVSLPPKRRLRRSAVVAVDSRELGHRIVKRVVGLPGEHLQLEEGRVYVDGRLLAEPYATPGTDSGTFDVPEGHYFLLGDDRRASSDSRRWRHPYVARIEIIGVLITRSPKVRVVPTAPAGPVGNSGQRGSIANGRLLGEGPSC